MTVVLGIDTSNYTTSAALYDLKTGELWQKKKLLPVKEGALGLRQSDAVFEHIRALPGILSALFLDFSARISAVGASDRPRGAPDSYMPCFLTGAGTAKSIGAAAGLPVFYCSHQAGHILAALYSAGSMELLSKPFIAFHLSGGTTEGVLVTPAKGGLFDCRVIAKSLDLKAGQAVDRVGAALGLSFPAGSELERLAEGCFQKLSVKASMQGADCSLSGVENRCLAMLERGEPREYVAAYCIASICAALEEMTAAVLERYGNLPLLYAGGVMSNRRIRERLTRRYNGRFADPEFSSDNAAGVALYAAKMLEREEASIAGR